LLALSDEASKRIADAAYRYSKRTPDKTTKNIEEVLQQGQALHLVKHEDCALWLRQASQRVTHPGCTIALATRKHQLSWLAATR